MRFYRDVDVEPQNLLRSMRAAAACSHAHRNCHFTFRVSGHLTLESCGKLLMTLVKKVFC